MGTALLPQYSLDLIRINKDLGDKSPRDVLSWSAATFGNRLAVQSSMQKTAGVIMHIIADISPQTEIVFVDTGVHFPETLQIRDEYMRRFGLNIKTCSPAKTFQEQHEEYGRDLHKFDDRHSGEPGYLHCCHLRKKVPFLKAVQGRFDAIVSGLMRSEGAARKDIQIVAEDPRIPAYTIHPLANWTEEQVDAYTAEHDLPVHPLYAQGYPSIGCLTCTTAVRPGEDKRAGRWRHLRENKPDSGPLYCGINLNDLRDDSASGI